MPRSSKLPAAPVAMYSHPLDRVTKSRRAQQPSQHQNSLSAIHPPLAIGGNRQAHLRQPKPTNEEDDFTHKAESFEVTTLTTCVREKDVM